MAKDGELTAVWLPRETVYVANSLMAFQVASTVEAPSVVARAKPIRLFLENHETPSLHVPNQHRNSQFAIRYARLGPH